MSYIVKLNIFILSVFVFKVGIGFASPVSDLIRKIGSDETYYQLKLTNQQKTDFLSSVSDIIENAYSERNERTENKSFTGFFPSDLRNIYFTNVQELYLNGYTSQGPINSWISDFNNLLNTNIDTAAEVLDSDTDEEKAQKRFEYIKSKIILIHSDFLNRVDNASLSCAGEGAITGNRKCCVGHIKLNAQNEFLPNNNSCGKKGNSCNSHSDCCSAMCEKDSPDSAGVCVQQTYCSAIRQSGESCSQENYLCENSRCMSVGIQQTIDSTNTCKKATKTCSSSSECCSGSCQSGQCIDIKKCMNCKSGGGSVGGSETCCPGWIKQNGKCVAPYPVFVPTVEYKTRKEKSLFYYVKILLNKVLIPASYADIDNNSINTTEAVSTNISPTTTAEKEEDTDARADYFDGYGIPGITSKTYSNIKTCEFNSFNDSWRDASNKERNAEIFLRSFEYVYSHKGTEDFWVDGTKGNIFNRAKAVAEKFRENRTELLKNMQAMDIKMTCKCMSVYGLTAFNEVKVNFFNNNCPDEKALLASQAANNSDNADDEALTDDVSDLTTIDEKAVGLSLEKLIIEWLELRADAQVHRFTDNSELEEELTALSTYISSVDFDKVFKDRALEKALNSDVHLIEGNPVGDSVLLYKWGYTYRPGWFKIFNFLTLGLAEAIFFNKLFDFDKGKAASSKASVTHSMQAAWRYTEIDDIDSTPEIADVKTLKKKCVKKILVCVKYADGFHRYYVGPRFENNSSSSNTKCRVPSRASSCFKSAYRVDVNDEPSYVMDPTLPLFVDENLIKLDAMPGYNDSFASMIQTARDSGIAYLKSLKPSGTISKTGGYLKGGDKFGNTDHLAKAIENGHFVPAGGNLKIVYAEEVNNGMSIKSAIIAGAKQYALCKSLKNDCGATSINNKELVGYGYLFEDENEAAAFAEYTYDIHWKWGHLSKNSYMGYPLQGMAQYFQLASYSMSLVGSYALKHALDYKKAAELYTADFDAREVEYQANGTAQTGERQAEAEGNYQSTFYRTLSNLSFSGASNLEVFDEAVMDGKSSGSLSSAELSTLASARSSAAIRNEAIKSAESLETAAASSNSTAQKALANNSVSLNEASNPLNSFTLRKLGDSSVSSQSTGSSASTSLNGSADDDSPKSESQSELGSKRSSGFDMAKLLNGMNSNNSNSGSFRANSYGTSYSSNMDSPTKSSINTGENKSSGSDSGLSGGEVNNLLDGLNDSNLNPSASDTLFTIVSKAYKRNYSRVLTRVIENQEPVREEIKLKSKEEKELRSLLTD